MSSHTKFLSIVGIAVVGFFEATVLYITYRLMQMTEIPKEGWVTLGLVIGNQATLAGVVVHWAFSSSRSSSDKDAIIAKMSSKQPTTGDGCSK